MLRVNIERDTLGSLINRVKLIEGYPDDVHISFISNGKFITYNSHEKQVENPEEQEALSKAKYQSKSSLSEAGIQKDSTLQIIIQVNQSSTKFI